MSFELHTPLALLLLALIPLLIVFERSRTRRAALLFPSTRVLGRVPRTWRQRLAVVPAVLRYAALALTVVALSRPMSGRNPIRNVTEGIAMEMVLDRSGSMSEGMSFHGKTVSRFDAVKEVFSSFVMGDRSGLPGRPDDLIGVIAFAGYPDTISPLTQSRDTLAGVLKELTIISDPSKDGTAIGDAIALAAARLKAVEEGTQAAALRGDRFRIKSKVIILLTDGEQNAGKRAPADAAELARSWGVKIYTIGVASQAGGGFGDASAALLQQVADTTGGVFQVAADERSLRAVYAEIDRLEKSEVSSIRYLSIREHFAPFALAALALLLLEAAASRTLFRRIP
jgi:Ca-activated chloride channel homolog